MSSSSKEDMWKCEACSRYVPADFEVCWNCGAAGDGTPDPGFASVAEAERRPSVQPSLEQKIVRAFKCGKCQHRFPHVKRIAVTGTGLSRLMDMQHNKYLSVSCARCGFTEFYEADVLGSNSAVGDILDLIFG